MDTTKSPADRGKCQQGLKMSTLSVCFAASSPKGRALGISGNTELYA